MSLVALFPNKVLNGVLMSLDVCSGREALHWTGFEKTFLIKKILFNAKGFL